MQPYKLHNNDKEANKESDEEQRNETLKQVAVDTFNMEVEHYSCL
jgi:hypothetical protein